MASDLMIHMNKLWQQELRSISFTRGDPDEPYANGRLDAIEECIKLIREDEKKHGFA